MIEDLADLMEGQVRSMGMRALYISCVGSHMWGMQNRESDIDLVAVYAAHTRSILRGQRISPTIRQQIAPGRGVIYDTMGWEIGHLINQLIKGNINAIWYASSPLVVKPSIIQEELSALVKDNLCRESYRSIKGMAQSQMKSEDKPAEAGKGRRTALRTINFGIRLLRQGRIVFAPVLHTPGAEEVREKMSELDYACEASSLPDGLDEEVFREFLLRLRLEGVQDSE
ncbi:MAG: nucleotidyltransferase domain-containing protein [Syntrophomonas sp.]|nr:nucleotidyltransferase domain-containing protein [Syntrophomonas sp.]